MKFDKSAIGPIVLIVDANSGVPKRRLALLVLSVAEASAAEELARVTRKTCQVLQTWQVSRFLLGV